jgi:hypothetical protein
VNPQQRVPVRASTVVKPTVRSDDARRVLVESMRRLGVDEEAFDRLVGRRHRRVHPA